MFIQTQLLIFLLGSMPFKAFAEEASTVQLEAETTPDFQEENTTLLPTRLHKLTAEIPLEELMTTESAVATNEDGEMSTDPDVAENSEDEIGGEPATPEEKGGLGTVALVGIIVGIIIAVGIVIGVIITVVRKMSGRYSMVPKKTGPALSDPVKLSEFSLSSLRSHSTAITATSGLQNISQPSQPI